MDVRDATTFRIPEDADELVGMMEEERGGLTDQERNLAIAQAELIGDL